MADNSSFHLEEEKYEFQGMVEGYEVYIRYAEEGPDEEEVWALFEEASNNLMFRALTGLGEELTNR